MSENLDTLFDAARKLPLDEQRRLAEKLLEAAKESDDNEEINRDLALEWNALTELIDESAVDIDISDLAHEHDHYLYGKTKKN